MRLFAGRVVGIGAALDAGRDVSCDAVLDVWRVVGCGRFGTIVWGCVGDIFGEVNLKILHIVAKNSSRHF